MVYTTTQQTCINRNKNVYFLSKGQNSKRNTFSGWSQLQYMVHFLSDFEKQHFPAKQQSRQQPWMPKVSDYRLKRSVYSQITPGHTADMYQVLGKGTTSNNIGQHILHYWHHDRSWFRSQNTQTYYMCLHGDDTAP